MMRFPAVLFILAAPLVLAKPTRTVAPDGSAPFRSIQAAIDSVTDATRENPVEILVLPGRYFEMITTRDWVNISGTERDACIVEYDRKPAEPHHKTHVISATSHTVLRNLTLIGRDVKYCIHSDGGREFVLTVENCVLRREYPENFSRIRAAFGIGLRGRQHIVVRNCRFEADLSLFFHNWDQQATACSLTIANSFLTGVEETIRVNNLGSGQRDALVLHDNTLRSERPIIRYLNASRPPPLTHRGASEIRVFASGNDLRAPGWGVDVIDDARERKSGIDRVAAD